MNAKRNFLSILCLTMIFSLSVNMNVTYACKGMWEAVDQIELTEASSTITFDNISSDYKMLKLVFNVGSSTEVGAQVRLRFNDDTSANYKHYIKSLWSDLSSGVDDVNWIYLAHMSPTAEGFSVGEGIISNINSQYKRVTGTWSDMWKDGWNGSGYSFFGMSSGVWKDNSTTISKIILESNDGAGVTSFAAGSIVTLMGIR